MTPAHAPSRPPRVQSSRSGGRRFLRRAGLTVVLLAVVAGVSMWVVTRSWFIIWLATGQLERKLGGEVDIRTAEYRGDGVLVFEDLTLRTRVHQGTAAEVLSVARGRVVVDMSTILFGPLQIRSVDVDGVKLRLSEDVQAPGEFNFAGLRPDWSSNRGSEEPLLPPSVRIDSAIIEMGMHVGSAYRLLGQRRVAGQMYPSADGGGWYAFQLGEFDAHGNSLGRDGVTIKGRWNVQTLEHWSRIEGLALDRRTFGMCPQIARLWWQRMQPEGGVTSAIVRWKPGQPLVAELIVDHMGLTIPIATDGVWASYQQGRVIAVESLPRMFVERGTIRLEGDELTLDNLFGVLGSSEATQQAIGMPYRVSLSIHELPTFGWENKQQWMEQVLETAPFEMNLEMQDFSLAQSTSPDRRAVDMPRQVALTLAKFNMTGFSLSTNMQITRAAPKRGAGGQPIAQPIHTAGQAYISDASGAYQAFPYPLEQVSAHVEFDNERVTILDLAGKGSDDSAVWMSGSISPLGKDASVHLRLSARNVPLDDGFQQALKGGELQAFKQMLHRPSYEALAAEGLLPDEAAIDAARRDRQEKIAELVQLSDAASAPGFASRRRYLEREIDRLATLIEVGAFELGGRVDLDLAIDRKGGLGNPTEVTGTVTIHKAGVVYERFPYPVYIRGGTLRIEKNRVVVVSDGNGKGIPIATAGGGRGTVSGEVRLPRAGSGDRVAPDLIISLVGDAVNDLLYAALPLGEDEKADVDEAHTPRPLSRRSRVARVLAGAGLTGWLDGTGSITSDDAGRAAYDFSVKLYDAVAQPTDALFQSAGLPALTTPGEFQLTDVQARLHITPESIDLTDFSGRRGGGSLTANGEIDLKSEPSEASLTVRFYDLNLEQYLIDLAPQGQRERIATLWERYQPAGTLDGRLRYHARGGESDPLELMLWPKDLRLLIDDRPVWLIRERGELFLSADQITTDGLALRVRGDGRDDGLIVLDGTYGTGRGAPDLRLHGTWTAGQLASPLIVELFRLAGAEGQAERYRGHDPCGTFEAQFTYESPLANRPRNYEVTVRPDMIALELNDTPVYLDFEDGTEIVFEPGRVIMRDVRGSHAGGRFRVDGIVKVSGLLDADLRLDYDGRLDSPQALAPLPQSLRATLESLKLQAAEAVHLKDASLRITQVHPTESGGQWKTAFAGRLQTEGASFDAGVEFTEIDGVFDVRAEHEPGEALRLEVGARADRIRALGRELTNVEAKIQLADDGHTVSLPEFRADLYGGTLTMRASVGLEPESDYQASIDLVGVSLEEFATGTRLVQPGVVAPAPQDGNPPTGDMYGSLSVGGQRGRPETRRGRGALRVSYGQMVNMPVTLRVLQLFELMPPLGGSLDFADVAFYLDEDHVVFERLNLECLTLQLVGEGDMGIPSLELNVRFRTRGTVPLVRDLIAGLSDRLFLIEVTGPLGDPQARLVPLPAVSHRQVANQVSRVADARAE